MDTGRMDSTTMPGGEGAAVRPRRRNRRPAHWLVLSCRWATRFVVAFHALMAFAQPVLAGAFIAGDFDAVAVHSAVGGSLLLLAAAQAVMVIVLWPLDRRPWWGAVVALLLPVVETAQITLGHAVQLTVHVPLGVAIVTAAAALLVWAWRRSAPPGGAAAARPGSTTETT